MNIAPDITALIGRTPLVKLNRCIDSGTNLVAAKLEFFNPCASVKDRAAYGMVEAAEREGRIKPGSTLIEATSGNTGIALAFIAAARGYKLIVVMPDSMSIERRRLLIALGAKVELSPAHEGMQGAIDKTNRLAETISDSFIVGQFANEANPAIHEVTTGPEILADTDRKIDVFVAGVGTGGSLTGVGRFLKKHNPQIKIVAVEPHGSDVLSGGSAGPHMIQGIGAGFVPQIFDKNIVDEVVKVNDSEAFEWTRRIVREEGVAAGISSGAALCGANKYIKKHNLQNKIVVVLFPDAAERYLSVPMLFSENG